MSALDYTDNQLIHLLQQGKLIEVSQKKNSN